MVTILEVGRTCKAPILKVGVSCIEAISKEKVSCTAVCMAPAGCGVPAVAGVLTTGAVGVWIGSGMVADGVVCGTEDSVKISELKAGVSTASISVIAGSAADTGIW